MIRTTVMGAAGRMGRLLVRHVIEDAALELVAAVEAADSPALGQDAGTLAGLAACGVPVTADIGAALAASDAVIDFTAPDCTMRVVAAARAGLSLVIGTTGLSADQRAAVAAGAARGVRIVAAPNMSVGVNLLFHLCAKVVPILGADYDIEVVEMHHNRKKDAPSGTAVRLGEILAESAGLDYAQAARHGREGLVGARTKREIGMHAVRGGDVVGDHTVVFATDGERVELTHKASSRETFVKGAIRAVKFLAAAPAGLYDMQDVLGLRA